jgi:hypothetical protein
MRPDDPEHQHLKLLLKWMTISMTLYTIVCYGKVLPAHAFLAILLEVIRIIGKL